MSVIQDTGWVTPHPDSAMMVEIRRAREALDTAVSRTGVTAWGYTFTLTPEIPYGLLVQSANRAGSAGSLPGLYASKETVETMLATTPDELMKTSELISAMINNDIEVQQLWADAPAWISSIVRAVTRMVEDGSTGKAKALVTTLRHAQGQLQNMEDQLNAALYVAESVLEVGRTS